jgi:hypothetical protein
MKLSTGRIKLNSAMKTLAVHWEKTQAQWRDPVSERFHEEYYEPLAEQVHTTLRAIDRLGEVIERVYQELQSS